MTVVMKSKFKGKCRRCYKSIKVDELIEWNPEKKTARHKKCKKKMVFTYGGKGRKVA